MATKTKTEAAPDEGEKAPEPTIQEILDAALAEGKTAFLVSNTAVRVDA